MRTINFNQRDNENLDVRDYAQVAKRVASIMEQHSKEEVMSVEYDEKDIIEYHENEEETIRWSIGNINYNDDGTIDSVQIHC